MRRIHNLFCFEVLEMSTANPFGQQRAIPGVDKIIAVGSGKGGVGKSTVAINLAEALAKLGKRVGLLDADIYGPSVPRLVGAINQKAALDENNKIIPLQRYGLNVMSLGFLVPEDSAVIWRGPMLFKALEQLLKDVAWGDLDYLVVDLPPGTGDVPLTLAQKVPIDHAIVVCTPQNMALADAKKAIDMFKRISIPVMGVVENMSHYLSPTGEKLPLFPAGELHSYLEKNNIKNLVQIPFTQNLAASAEIGMPVRQSFPNDPAVSAFENLANSLLLSQSETPKQNAQVEIIT